MTENERGTVTNPSRFRQDIRFEGMQYDRHITPTDFDACIEYKNTAWIICEVKHRGKELPPGQLLAIDRFVQDMYKAGKTVLAIITEHDKDNPSEPIILKDCVVRQYKVDYGDWERMDNITTGRLIEQFIKRIDEKLAVRNPTSPIFRTEKEKDKL